MDQQGVDDAEHGGVGADAQGQHQNDGCRDHRSPQHDAGAETRVL